MVSSPNPARIAYLIPEFPGQTHGFFMRERSALCEQGIEASWVSTRPPPEAIVSHTWADEAIAQTHYLLPLSLARGGAIVWELARCGPAAWLRCLRQIGRAECSSRVGRVGMSGLVAAAAELSWLARRHGWRHVHVHSCADAANVAMFARLLSGLPYSLTLHGPLEDYGPNQAQKFAEARFAIVITRKLFEEVRATLPQALPSRLEIAPMGVDTDQFQRSVPYRVWDGIGPCRIASCGRLHPAKGHADLIRAVEALRRAGIDAHLEIAGEDNTTGEHRRELERLIAERGLGQAVTLLGAVSEARVRESLEAAHVFALASHAEPLGVAIMEAMAMELPVVVTRAGGVPELVDDSRDGRMVEPGSPDALAAAIQELLDDPGLALRLGRAGRKKIEERFSSRRSAALLAQLLRDTAATPDGSSEFGATDRRPMGR